MKEDTLHDMTFEETLDYSSLIETIEEYCNTPVDTLDIMGMLGMKQKLLLVQAHISMSIIAHRKEYSRFFYQHKSTLDKVKRTRIHEGSSAAAADAEGRYKSNFYRHKEILHETYIDNYKLLYYQAKEQIDAIAQHVSYLKDEKRSLQRSSNT